MKKTDLSSRAGPDVQTGGQAARVEGAPLSWIWIALVATTAACNGTAAEEEKPKAEKGDVSLEVSYQNGITETATQSLQAWFLEPRGDNRVTCANLIAGTADPYDFSVVRLADVALTDLSAPLEFEAEVGDGLLYVEAVDFSGEAHLAGCVSLKLGKGGASASVPLGKAGVYDCADDATDDGARCDDGLFCTVGERCDGGECAGGRARDCSGETSSCSAGTCSEDKGCEYVAQPDDTPCDDGLYCTTNDACHEGRCQGTTRDCSAEAGVCQIGSACYESELGCYVTTAPTYTACDDENFCTLATECYLGACSLSARNRLCPTSDCVPTNGCSTLDEACAPSYAAPDTACDDNPCLEGAGTCDAVGNCTGTPVTDGVSCTVGCRTGTCDAGVCALVGNASNGTYCENDSGQCLNGDCAEL